MEGSQQDDLLDSCAQPDDHGTASLLTGALPSSHGRESHLGLSCAGSGNQGERRESPISATGLVVASEAPAGFAHGSAGAKAITAADVGDDGTSRLHPAAQARGHPDSRSSGWMCTNLRDLQAGQSGSASGAVHRPHCSGAVTLDEHLVSVGQRGCGVPLPVCVPSCEADDGRILASDTALNRPVAGAALDTKGGVAAPQCFGPGRGRTPAVLRPLECRNVETLSQLGCCGTSGRSSRAAAGFLFHLQKVFAFQNSA